MTALPYRTPLRLFSASTLKVSSTSVEPDERRPLRDLRILRNLLQVRAALRPLEHNRPSLTHHTRRDQKLVLRSTKLHAPNLINAGVHLLHELQLGLDGEDGDSVPARVDVACVAVRDVDEGLGEAGGGFGEEDLACVHVRAGREVVREDGEISNDERGAIRCCWDLLLSQGARELVQSVERVSCVKALCSASVQRRENERTEAYLGLQCVLDRSLSVEK